MPPHSPARREPNPTSGSGSGGASKQKRNAGTRATAHAPSRGSRRGAHGRHGGGGRSAHGRAAGTVEQQHVELASALASLRRRRDGLENVLIGDPRSRQGLWELNSALLTTVDRMLLELDAATITVDPDQPRTRQALGRLRAAVHDAIHRPDSRAASGQGPPESTDRPYPDPPCREALP